MTSAAPPEWRCFTWRWPGDWMCCWRILRPIPSEWPVAGLREGGWQTIFLSALDPRVTLANPVAGYSSLLTRTRFWEDLGDSEQIPCDLATVADYTHLTALRAPRPMLLTYNAKDNCCFAAAHALGPLWEAALPIYQLYGQERRLRSHINETPGDHNFGLDNRQGLYRMLGTFSRAETRTITRWRSPARRSSNRRANWKWNCRRTMPILTAWPWR